MPQLSYGRAMDWLADREPDRVAIASRLDGRVDTRSRRQLVSRANRLARAYAALGVGEGDLVTIALPNGCEFFEAALATWKLGATPNPVSARLPEVEQRAIVDTASPALVVGVEPGRLGDRPTIQAGFEPDASLGDEPLPDRVTRHVRAMTSGGCQPKIEMSGSLQSRNVGLL